MTLWKSPLERPGIARIFDWRPNKSKMGPVRAIGGVSRGKFDGDATNRRIRGRRNMISIDAFLVFLFAVSIPVIDIFIMRYFLERSEEGEA